MPQEFHVLRCFSCLTFQVHIVKKSSNKWQCKMCNEKQSLKKVYGQGSGKECRLQVQQLNSTHLAAAEQQAPSTPHPRRDQQCQPTRSEHAWQQSVEELEQGGPHRNTSKWSRFLEVKQRSPSPSLEEEGQTFEKPPVKRRKSAGSTAQAAPASERDVHRQPRPSLNQQPRHRTTGTPRQYSTKPNKVIDCQIEEEQDFMNPPTVKTQSKSNNNDIDPLSRWNKYLPPTPTRGSECDEVSHTTTDSEETRQMCAPQVSRVDHRTKTSWSARPEVDMDDEQLDELLSFDF